MHYDFKKDSKYINFLLEKMNNGIISTEEYRYLQFLLMKYELMYTTDYPLCQTSITGDKILFTSDAHVGSIYESRHLFDTAHNAALKKGIKTSIHVGDFTEATAHYWEKPKEEALKELERAISYLPYEIVTQLLLGNHEYSAIKTYPELIHSFFNEPKLNILGMQKVMLDWDGAIFRLNHYITQLKCKNEEAEPKGLMEINGHHHWFSFSEEFRMLRLPSLSEETYSLYDSILYERGITASYAFVIASKEEQNIRLFRVYSVDKKHNLLYPSSAVEVNTESKQLRFYKS